jgi:hypothetical protein
VSDYYELDGPMNLERECQFCEEWFEFDVGDIFLSSEIVEGQYTEYSAIQCPHCEMTNRW